jgi:hypothetical protein
LLLDAGERVRAEASFSSRMVAHATLRVRADVAHVWTCPTVNGARP